MAHYNTNYYCKHTLSKWLIIIRTITANALYQNGLLQYELLLQTYFVKMAHYNTNCKYTLSKWLITIRIANVLFKIAHNNTNFYCKSTLSKWFITIRTANVLCQSGSLQYELETYFVKNGSL